MFLQRWAYDHNIRLKLFNPKSISAGQTSDTPSSMREFDIATLNEMIAFLARANARYAQAA